MLDFCLFGAGRIGRIHAASIAAHPRARLRYVVDPSAAMAVALASEHGARMLPDAAEALADPAVGAVVVASPTPTHVALVTASARAGKAVFCEKPIDLDMQRVARCEAALAEAGVPFFLAFNRRFDPSFRRLQQAVRAGEVGAVETVIITSRDPAPPPPSYVRESGGLFRDMMIHDLDMARWLLNSEPVEVYACASCLVDPAIGEAGDVDTAVVVMRTADGALCTISNSRRAVYGYDQRLEVFGAGGMLQAGNHTPTTVTRWQADGVHADKPLFFFLERYAEAYRAELDHFVTAVLDGGPLETGVADGRLALALADAAHESSKSGRPTKPRGNAR